MFGSAHGSSVQKATWTHPDIPPCCASKLLFHAHTASKMRLSIDLDPGRLDAALAPMVTYESRDLHPSSHVLSPNRYVSGCVPCCASIIPNSVITLCNCADESHGGLSRLSNLIACAGGTQSSP